MVKPVFKVTSLVGSLDVRVDGGRISLVQPDKDVISFTLAGRTLNELCQRVNGTGLAKAELILEGESGAIGSLVAKSLVRTGSIHLEKPNAASVHQNLSYTFKADVQSLRLPEPKQDTRIIHVVEEEDLDQPYIRIPSSGG